MKRKLTDGKLAYQTNVKKGHRQLDVSIPIFLQELFGIKAGDKFNWYVKREGNRISLQGVYIKYNSMKFIKEKELGEKREKNTGFGRSYHCWGKERELEEK